MAKETEIELTPAEKAAFVVAMQRNKDALHALRLKVTAAEIRAAEIKDLFDAVEAEALADMGDVGKTVATGYRLLDADFDRWNTRCLEISIARGYTNPNGKEKPQYQKFDILRAAENALVEYQLSLLPASLRETIANRIKKDYNTRRKFIDLAMLKK